MKFDEAIQDYFDKLEAAVGIHGWTNVESILGTKIPRTSVCRFGMDEDPTTSWQGLQSIYLAKASILIQFLHQLSSIASKTITLHPPCAPRRSCFLSYPSPVPPGCFRLVVVRISIVWQPFQAASYFFLLLQLVLFLKSISIECCV